MRLLSPLLALALLVSPAVAHEFVRDGEVGGLIHLEPDDEPVVGKPTLTWFEVTRRGGAAVTTATCVCTLSLHRGAVTLNVKPVARLSLVDGKTGDSRGKLSATLTFPDEGAYTLVLNGRPRTTGQFQPFELVWTVRAEATAGEGH